ncbi:hypothetical protein B0T17DRAFT_523635 [Bombardia bombarda]|uniref:Uncharacterized protein n=1 Tax=Bombardia bombarda TaxID=252184 RepID=A0AA39X7K1_9PEZI|nr:hypothetical protein B0T17DRAFT_523635 [Bombardia bombarda]
MRSPWLNGPCATLGSHLAKRPDPVLFAGMVLVAPFADVELLTATYRVAGMIPILDPVAYFPRVLAFLNAFIKSKWPSKDKLADFVEHRENMTDDGQKYHVTIIHAQDDYDIPWSHSDQVFWHAVSATQPTGISYEELEEEKKQTRIRLKAARWSVDHETKGPNPKRCLIRAPQADRTSCHLNDRSGPGDG